MTIIFGSFIAFALQGYKVYLTNEITDKFRETKGINIKTEIKQIS